MNEATLFDMFKSHTGRQIDKWEHYFPIYEKHFAKYRGKKLRLLELGVDHGGSLQMWKRYFGRGADIIGIDINPQCAMYSEEQITVYTADQCDPPIAALGPFDIVIDDGSHVPEHINVSFQNIWPQTTGVYLIEDIPGYYPALPRDSIDLITYSYPGVCVIERPKRMIVGKPSHPYREDEAEARAKYGV